MINKRTQRLLLGIVCLVFATATPAAAHDDSIKRALSELRRNPEDRALKEKLAQEYVKAYRGTEDKKFRDSAVSQYEKIFSEYNECDHNAKALYQVMAERALDKGPASDLKKLHNLISTCPKMMDSGYMPPSMIEYFYFSETEKLSTEDSIALLRNSIRESPDYPVSHVILSGLYRKQSQMDLALFVIQNAKTRLPDNRLIAWQFGELLLDKLWFRSDCYVDSPDELPKAIQALKQAVPVDPYNSGLHSQLSLALRLAGHADLSAFEARKAYELESSHYNLRNLVTSLLAQQNSAKAMQLMMRESHTFFNLTRNHEGSGRKDSAGSAKSKSNGKHGVQPERRQPKNSAIADAEWLTDIFNALDGVRSNEEKKEMAAFIGDMLAMTAQWKNANKFLSEMERNGVDINFYTFLRLLNSQKMSGSAQEARKMLKRRYDPEELWYRQRELYDYFMGSLTDEELLERSINDCEKTEAYYHIGIDRLANGNRAEARRFFAKVLELPTHGYREHIGARYVLNYLEDN